MAPKKQQTSSRRTTRTSSATPGDGVSKTSSHRRTRSPSKKAPGSASRQTRSSRKLAVSLSPLLSGEEIGNPQPRRRARHESPEHADDAVITTVETTAPDVGAKRKSSRLQQEAEARKVEYEKLLGEAKDLRQVNLQQEQAIWWLNCDIRALKEKKVSLKRAVASLLRNRVPFVDNEKKLADKNSTIVTDTPEVGGGSTEHDIIPAVSQQSPPSASPKHVSEQKRKREEMAAHSTPAGRQPFARDAAEKAMSAVMRHKPSTPSSLQREVSHDGTMGAFMEVGVSSRPRPILTQSFLEKVGEGEEAKARALAFMDAQGWWKGL
ncbi:hypothetical protein NA57DRAFT_59517 [Rhizodiscina lignyota]|uniref:Uncharacterized protein n=1 Tax=Rhizodiscina lignyota TaxID=1504668 RepID=A0A9P4I7Q3_9PEZI|nr:hypothetical protein NA57DRAFT_59517 [Rhizodiscina lignyota]